jgi:Tol biopolymer transport system component
LKPANIMLTKSGAKLMDFGLAKATAVGAAGSPSAPLLSAALTAEGPSPVSPLTTSGSIVGTIQYMSPEQIEGKDADVRSDIFAFGAVLYEMAAGKRAFEGKSQISVASAILEKDPEPLSAVQPMSPAALDSVVRTCLEKDPEKRWNCAHDLRLELMSIRQKPNQVVSDEARATPWKVHALWAAAAIALALAALFLGYWRSPARATQVYRATLLPPDKSHFSSMVGNGPPIISPDGTRMVFVAVTGDQQAIWLRHLDRIEATQLIGSENGTAPFWSPDGTRIGFFAEGKLWKTDASGGPPVPICAVREARGGSWGTGDVIVFAPSTSGTLMRVSANGGEPEPATKLQTGFFSHRWPYFLPDGKHFLYLSSITGRGQDGNQVRFSSTNGSEDKLVTEANFSPRYANGKLLFVRKGVLLAQDFDAEHGTSTGETTAVVSQVEFDELTASALFSASANGVLLYQAGSGVREQLTWFDRAGKTLGTVGAPGNYQGLSLSPDDTRLAVMRYAARNGLGEIWLLDLKTGTWTKLSFVEGDSRAPVWSADGKTIYFASLGANGGHIYAKPADGSRQEQEVLASKELLTVSDVSPDGKVMLIETTLGRTAQRVSLAAPNSKPEELLASSTGFSHARISPDRQWLAFQSNETGPLQVYVSSYPAPSAKYQVSVNGGVLPLWSRDGKTLYFLGLDRKLMASNVTRTAGGLQFTPPVVLFPTNVSPSLLYSGFVVTRDGKFLVTQRDEEQSTPVTMVVNWTADLKK